MPNLPDTLDFDELGGALQNYSSVADSTTDRDAAASNLAFDATSAMSRTADRAWVKFIWDGTDITVLDWDAVWGKDDAYAPVVLRTATGVYPVSWPSTVTDDLDVAHSINLRMGIAGVENSDLQISLEVTSPTTATFRVTNPATGSSADIVSRAVVGVFK